ncbi:MAG: hypothetical protein IJW94_03395 [Oscillospiraceae bacterium]|nr:hypothetical protein [Oscillospiraceae bacterium]
MADIYTETIVKRKPMPGGAALQGVLAVAAILAAMIGLYINVGLLVVAAAAGVGWYLVRQNAYVEFEYIHTNGDLDIDKVISNASRKRVMTVNLDHVEVVAPLESQELRRYNGSKARDFSAKNPQEPPYVMVYNQGGVKALLLLQLDDKMVKSLKKWMPGKVFTE